MRLFIGIALSDDLAAQTARVLDELRGRVQSQAPHARVTWVARDRLHVTVRFLGEVNDELRARIEAALSAPLSQPAFDMTLAGLGAFPSPSRPRVFWAGLASGREAVVAIEREIAGRLDPLLGPAEERGFHPHVTLGRVKHGAGLHGRLLDGLDATRVGSMRVETVTLFESRLSPKGPTYARIGEGRLKGGPYTTY